MLELLKKNKRVVWIVAAALSVLLVMCVVLAVYKKRNNTTEAENYSEEYVTRAEWIQMLCDTVGILEYDQTTPYFQDVPEDSEYFSCVQAAVEAGVIEPTEMEQFEGEKTADGSFIAVTAMKTVGESKLRIFQKKIEEEFSDKNYLQIAVDNGLVYKQELAYEFPIDRCRKVLDKLKELYFGKFWRTDYCMVRYQDNVVVVNSSKLPEKDIQEGTVVVLDESETGIKAAYKVDGRDSEGNWTLSDDLELDEVISYLAVSDIKAVTFEDIAGYYDLEEESRVTDGVYRNQQNIYQTAVDTLPIDYESKGFKISLFEEDNKLKASITDNEKGISYELPLEAEIDVKNECSVDINISKIIVAGQAEYKFPINWNYAEVAVDIETDISGHLKMEDTIDRKIKLFSIPPIDISNGTGLASIPVEVYGIITAEGEISIEAEVPMSTSIRYDKGQKPRCFDTKVSVKNPKIEINCEANGLLCVEPQLVILKKWNVLDAELSMGVGAKAEKTVRLEGEECYDIVIAAPIQKIGLCTDDEVDSVLGKLGVSGEWEIISFENAPWKFNRHYEILADNTSGFVEKCTFEEEEEEKESILSKIAKKKEDTKIELNHTYTTQFGEIKFAFDYPDGWTMGEAVSDETFVECLASGLESENGSAMTYFQYKIFPLGGHGHASYLVGEWEKIGDTSIDSVVVGKFQVNHEEDPETGKIYPTDDLCYYALINESEVGGERGMMGLSGVYEESSFVYNNNQYTFVAERVEETDEEAIIAILSSFRLAEE